MIRYLCGDPTWCFAHIRVAGRKALPADVKPLGEGIGLGLGDHITATYGLPNGAVAHYTTLKAKAGAGSRYWLEIRGTKGIVHLGYGAIPLAFLCVDPTWMPAKSKAPWQEITSAGIGKPEPLVAAEVGNGNRWIADDLIEAIEKDRQPLDSIADGRAALEMILAIYESHRLERPVEFPLKNRKHPLAGSG